MSDLLIHIGTHKTATTSFQVYLRDRILDLEQHGIAYLPQELSNLMAIIAVRNRLPIPGTTNWTPDQTKKIRRKLEQDVADFCRIHPEQTIVLSNEHLSYFRTKEEVDRVLELFPDSRSIHVFVVFREKEDFLKSYQRQAEWSGHGPVWDDKSSPFYCGRDSWLLDYQAVEAPWRTRATDLTVLRYETNDILADLIAAMGIPDLRNGKVYNENRRRGPSKAFLISVLKHARLFGPALRVRSLARSMFRKEP